jgi:hypothetical protein
VAASTDISTISETAAPDASVGAVDVPRRPRHAVPFRGRWRRLSGHGGIAGGIGIPIGRQARLTGLASR